MKQSFITILRNKHSTTAQFRHAAERLAHLAAHESLEKITKKEIKVTTPFGYARGVTPTQRVILIPILRAGLALLPVFLFYFNEARVGFIGLKRNEKTARAKQYYANLPRITARDRVIVLDPTIATGGSAEAALRLIMQQGVKEKQILFVSLIAAPEGVSRVRAAFPNIDMNIGTTDRGLNAKKFIIPGIGDFGDRYFGTES